MAERPPLDLRARAEPPAVGSLRRHVRRWLVPLLEDPDAADDLVLAVSEALENVVDHAFVDAPEPGTIALHAHHDDRHVVITVSDDGCWQPIPSPAPPSHRGRGLALIADLTDRTDVVTGADGTTVTLVHPRRHRAATTRQGAPTPRPLPERR